MRQHPPASRTAPVRDGHNVHKHLGSESKRLRPRVRRLLPLLLLLTGLFSLSGCGQLVTPEPVPDALPASSSTPVAVIPTVTPRATATPRPSTPAPTSTPTVTPTPIVYVVQQGDTLLGIAVQFDVAAEAIQEINGIVDPRFLQIGQELIIPGPEEDAEQPPTPTPTPLPMAVDGVSFQETPLGSLWCLGEVVNAGGQNVSEVVVEALLFDEEGTLLASASAFTQLNVVPRGGRVPFAIQFAQPPASFAQYQVNVIAGVALSPQTRYYLDLEATDLESTTQGAAGVRISGQLRNVGQEDVEAIRLVAAAYDDADRLLAQRQADLEVLLLRAGAITPFAIDLQLANGTVARYEVQAQGLRVP